MNGEFPPYYSRLAPFCALFEQGNPILTYHKLGRRPSRVRLKGMYLSERLFAQQLAELKHLRATGKTQDADALLQSIDEHYGGLASDAEQ